MYRVELKVKLLHNYYDDITTRSGPYIQQNFCDLGIAWMEMHQPQGTTTQLLGLKTGVIAENVLLGGVAYEDGSQQLWCHFNMQDSTHKHTSTPVTLMQHGWNCTNANAALCSHERRGNIQLGLLKAQNWGDS